MYHVSLENIVLVVLVYMCSVRDPIVWLLDVLHTFDMNPQKQTGHHTTTFHPQAIHKEYNSCNYYFHYESKNNNTGILYRHVHRI